MDNLTHTLLGAVLAETGLKRVTPLATTTLLLAVNLPDIDIVSAGFGRFAYIEAHRGLTHSVFGAPVLALLLAVGVYFYGRGRARFWPLLALSELGVATHPLLDFTNSYGWRPFLPLSERWYYIDLAFVIDPWIWAGLGGALLLVWARTYGRLVIWGAVFVVASALLLMGGGMVAAAVWFAAWALFALLRWRLNLTARAGRLVALNALAALLVYLSALAVLHHFALARVAEMTLVSIAANEQVVEIAALPTEINPLRWLAVVGTENAFYLAEILAFGSAEARFTRYPREEGNAEAIAAATRLEEAETLLRFARYPVSEAQPDGRGFAVRIEDIRFGGRTGTFRLDVRLDENLQPLGIN